MSETPIHPTEYLVKKKPFADDISNGDWVEVLDGHLEVLGLASLKSPFVIFPKSRLFSRPELGGIAVGKLNQMFGNPAELGFDEPMVYSVVGGRAKAWKGVGLPEVRLTAPDVANMGDANLARFGSDPDKIIELLAYKGDAEFARIIENWIKLRGLGEFQGMEASLITDVLEVGALLTSRPYKLMQNYAGTYKEVHHNFTTPAINDGLSELLTVLNKNQTFGLQVRHLRFFVEFKNYIRYDSNQDLWFYTGGYDERGYDPTRANQITPIVNGTLAKCWEEDKLKGSKPEEGYSRVFSLYEFEQPPKGKEGCDKCVLQKFCNEYLDSMEIDLKALKDNVVKLVRSYMEQLVPRLEIFCEKNNCCVYFFPGEGFGFLTLEELEAFQDQNARRIPLDKPTQSPVAEPGLTCGKYVSGSIEYADLDGSFVNGVPGVYKPLPEIDEGEIITISLSNIPVGHIIFVYAEAKKLALARKGQNPGDFSHVEITRRPDNFLDIKFFYKVDSL